MTPTNLLPVRVDARGGDLDQSAASALAAGESEYDEDNRVWKHSEIRMVYRSVASSSLVRQLEPDVILGDKRMGFAEYRWQPRNDVDEMMHAFRERSRDAELNIFDRSAKACA